jgi:hypothetical protein
MKKTLKRAGLLLAITTLTAAIPVFAACTYKLVTPICFTGSTWACSLSCARAGLPCCSNPNEFCWSPGTGTCAYSDSTQSNLMCDTGTRYAVCQNQDYGNTCMYKYTYITCTVFEPPCGPYMDQMDQYTSRIGASTSGICP